MHRILTVILVIALAGCLEPPKTNRALVYVGGLQDLTRWDPVNGGRGHDAYDAMLSLEPTDSAPVLIATLLDPTQTGIYDRLHEPVTVGDVAFHMLVLIFSMKPKDFESEGVWFFAGDPVKNPIFQWRIESTEVREKLRQRFAKLAIDRGWYPKE